MDEPIAADEVVGEGGLAVVHVGNDADVSDPLLSEMQRQSSSLWECTLAFMPSPPASHSTPAAAAPSSRKLNSTQIAHHLR